MGYSAPATHRTRCLNIFTKWGGGFGLCLPSGHTTALFLTHRRCAVCREEGSGTPAPDPSLTVTPRVPMLEQGRHRKRCEQWRRRTSSDLGGIPPSKASIDLSPTSKRGHGIKNAKCTAFADYQTSVLTSSGNTTRTRHLETCYEQDAKIDERRKGARIR